MQRERVMRHDVAEFHVPLEKVVTAALRFDVGHGLEARIVDLRPSSTSTSSIARTAAAS